MICLSPPEIFQEAYLKTELPTVRNHVLFRLRVKEEYFRVSFLGLLLLCFPAC
jgi:hypothetical protein